ncbi:ICMT-domain-containing protein [Trametes elegans]|nr:ICMT-domain-containing protein [Trametes elegans]
MDAPPIAKVPILLLNAILMYYGTSPPRPPPPQKEQEKFGRADYLSATTRIQLKLAAGLRAALGGPDIVEAITILAAHISSPLARRLLAILIPLKHPSSATAALRIAPLFLAGSALTILGGLGRVYCHRTLGRFFTWQVSVQDDHRLVTTGPYSVVRHPSYTAYAVLAIGKTLALLSRGSFLVESGVLDRWWGKAAAAVAFGYYAYIAVALLGRTGKEDDVLAREFGDEWRVWARRTPYRLIPSVY